MSRASNLRLVEEPLGKAAFERPTREDLLAAFAEACRRPPPRYSDIVLEKLFPERRP